MAHSGTIIDMQNVPGCPKLRNLTKPLPLKNMDGTDGFIPAPFVWNGASSGIFNGSSPGMIIPLLHADMITDASMQRIKKKGYLPIKNLKKMLVPHRTGGHRPKGMWA